MHKNDFGVNVSIADAFFYSRNKSIPGIKCPNIIDLRTYASSACKLFSSEERKQTFVLFGAKSTLYIYLYIFYISLKGLASLVNSGLWGFLDYIFPLFRLHFSPF